MAVLSQTTSSVKFTYEDFLLFPDDGRRHELIDGEHYVSPSPVTKHQRVLMKLLGCLIPFVNARHEGHLFCAPMDVVLSDGDVVEPDLLYISAGRESIITQKNIQGAPDLVIEILSEGSRKRDEIVKRKLYERHGVLEYWIVDPDLETVKVYQPVEGRYARTAELSGEGTSVLTSARFPGLEIPLSEIFG